MSMHSVGQPPSISGMLSWNINNMLQWKKEINKYNIMSIFISVIYFA